MAAGRGREALADFQAASEYPPRFERGEPYDGGRAPEVFYYLGLAREACGEDARDAFQRAIARPRKGTYLAYCQGLAWRRLGGEAKAADLFEDLLLTGRRVLDGASGVGFFQKFRAGLSDSVRQAQGRYLSLWAIWARGNSPRPNGNCRRPCD